MKKQRKYLFTAALFSLLIGCEKDIDNTIPGNPKERIEARCQNFNRIFTANTEKGKIWISDALCFPNIAYFHYQRTSFPFFIALKPKKENNINIYATVLYDTIQKDSPKDEFGLLSNPNQYSIQGTPSLSFSISQQSVLSSLSMEGISDFDFDVYQYNQDSIHLKSIHEVAQNKELIFRSYDFNDNVKAFFGACQNLFDIWRFKNDKSYFFYSSWQFEEHVSFFIKDSKDRILHKRESLNMKLYYLPHLIYPFYNKEKKLFAFKVKYFKDDDGKYQVKTFYRYRIKYLIPVSATEHEMVFSGLGKKLDSEGKVTEEDEIYTIGLSIID